MELLTTRTFHGVLMLTLLTACGGEDNDDVEVLRISNISAAISPHIGPVVTVSWTTNTPSTGGVYFGGNGDLTYYARDDNASTEHSVILIGVAEDSEVSYLINSVSSSDSSLTVESEVQSIANGSLPPTLPTFTTEGSGNDAFMALTVMGEWEGAILLNPDGAPVWFHKNTLHLDNIRARISQDGASVIYNAAEISGEGKEDPVLLNVSLDGSTVSTTTVELLAHDFVEHEDGTIGTLAAYYDDDKSPRGDSIVEIHPDGTQSTIWTAWDCYDPKTHPGDDDSLGWTWSNAMDFDAEEDAYYISLRNLSSIVKIDRATGTCEWGFSGTAGTIEITNGTAFHHQHQFEVMGDNIMVFDNLGSGFQSRAVEYEVDWANNTAVEVWEYYADPSIMALLLGDVHRFDNEDTLVTWSLEGEIHRVNAQGELLWKTVMSDNILGFNTVMSDFNRPD